MSLKNVKRKASKKLVKRNQTTIDFLWYIMKGILARRFRRVSFV